MRFAANDEELWLEVQVERDLVVNVAVHQHVDTAQTEVGTWDSDIHARRGAR